MAQHKLSLEAPDTLNKCILRVVDTSVYNDMMAVKCPKLEITPPGYKRPIVFSETEFSIGFSLNITACDLEMQTLSCGTNYDNLPDGIYILRYSVSPNEHVYVEYNHLRITCALNTVQGVYCDLDLGPCDPPEKTKATLNEIRMIEQYLKAAKAMVEFCHEPNKGMDLYRYALRLLNKLNCASCSKC